MNAKTEHKQRSNCLIACSLDIVGDHWTLLIIRNLMFSGIHEYKDMLQTDEQISSSILTTRLKKLEKEDIIASAPHPASQRRKLYYLTSKGKDLIHVLIHLAKWSNKHLSNIVDVPPEQEELLVNNPEQAVELTLQQLEQWEKENLSQLT